jgi:hypothetical protein
MQYFVVYLKFKFNGACSIKSFDSIYKQVSIDQTSYLLVHTDSCFYSSIWMYSYQKDFQVLEG